MRRILFMVLFAGLWVAGCSAGVPNGDGIRGFLPPGLSPAPLTRTTLAGGDIRLSGPSGYCIDPQTLSAQTQQSFALLASCRILSHGASGADVPAVLIAVTVGAPGSGTALPDPQALATVSAAPLVEAWTRDGLSLALLGRGGETAFEGVEPRYWRGAFVQARRLVGVALYVPRGSTLTPVEGADMLATVHAQVRAASPTQEAR